MNLGQATMKFVKRLMRLTGIGLSTPDKPLPKTKWKEKIQAKELKYWTRTKQGSYVHWHHLDNQELETFGLNARALKGKTVVDLGCGPRGILNSLPAGHRLFIDSLMAHYQTEGLLKKVLGCSYLAACGEELPLKDASIDWVICTNAIDHMFNPLQAAKEIARVLKPDGRLFLDVFYLERNLLGYHSGHPFDVTPDTLKKLLAGFTPEKETNKAERYLGVLVKKRGKAYTDNCR